MSPLRAAACLCAAVAVLAAGCGSAAPPRFHSLLGEPLRVAAPLLAWRLAPVAVPAQVDQPQVVLRRADGSLAVLERERWQAPLQDELRDALAEQLASRLGPAGQPAAAGRAEWRVTLDVQRFDTVPGRATLVAQWQLQSALNRAGLRCSVRLEQATAAGVPALAAGHQRNVQQLAAGLAASLVDLDAGRAAACPARAA
jgi:uncharacterized lipoprotein YmbA